MSGGAWGYSGSRIKYELHEIGEDERVVERFPLLAARLVELGDHLYAVERALDWDMCGDDPIKDDRAFEQAALKELRAETLDALKAVLLFYSAEWNDEKRNRWVTLTGQSEATTKVLCDTVRKALRRKEPA